MKITVKVPKGFLVFHRWVNGDLLITVQSVKTVRAVSGANVRRHGHHAPYQRVTAARGKPAADTSRTLVVTIDTDKRPTLSSSGTGSTGPRDIE